MYKVAAVQIPELHQDQQIWRNEMKCQEEEDRPDDHDDRCCQVGGVWLKVRRLTYDLDFRATDPDQIVDHRILCNLPIRRTCHFSVTVFAHK